MTRQLQTAVLNLGLAAIYFCAGSFGLSLASINPSASAVWPPSGIALAAVLLWGYRLAPGVFLGALLVNFWTQGSVATASTIAAGNTFEALLGAWLVCRFADGPKAFGRTRNLLLFILLAAILSTTVGATVGTTSLSVGGYAPWDDYAAVWLTWWLGDMVGNLIVAPTLVLWITQPLLPLKAAQLLEAGGLLLFLVFIGWILFHTTIPSGLEYFALVPLLWGAFRFGRRGAVTSALLMSGIALWGTLLGFGPFATSDVYESLLLLQLFMATITMTSLLMASVVLERRRVEQRLMIKDQVSRVLADSPSLADAAPKIVQSLCEKAGWDMGAVWNVSPTDNELLCVDVWSLPSIPVAAFAAATRQWKFPPGMGLPGRVWKTGQPAWIPDVTDDTNFPRAAMALKAGLHAAFGFPIKLTDEVLGVMECFSREIRDADDDFLEMVSNIGRQIGQFIERKRAEESLRAKEAQMRLIADTAPVMLVQCDRDGRYRFVNREYAERFGLTPEQIVGRTIPEVLGEDASETIRPYVQKVLQGEFVQYETEVPYERIGRRFMHVAYVPEKDAQGNIDGWVSAVSDITERKQTEETLRQRTRSLEIINRVGNQLTGELELDRIVRMVTDAGREISGAAFGAFFDNVTNEVSESYSLYALSGLSREAFEKIPMPKTRLFEPMFKSKGVIRIGDMLADSRYGNNPPHHGMPAGHLAVRSYLAVPVVSRSGEVLGALLFGHPKPDVFTAEAENIITAIASQASVSIDNANLYQSVQRRVEEFRKLIDTAPVGIAVATDAQCKQIWGNPEFLRMLGTDISQNISKSSAAGSQLPFKVFRAGREVPPQDLPMQRACREGTDVLDDELEIVRDDGLTIHEICRATPLRDELDQVRGCIGIFLNISERKQAEAALQRAKDDLAEVNESLERRVQERTAELEQANTALLREIEEEKRLEEQLRQVQKMESLGTLTGGIAHDFNNILNIIRGHTSFVGAIRPDDYELHRTVKIVDETIDRGSAIVQQLLAIARKSEAKLEQLNLNDPIKKLERLLSEIFPKTIHVALRLDPRLPPVTADPNQIDQVLLNIALNARDAMPEGGRLLVTTAIVSGAELRARFHDAKAEHYALISVADTGSGMDEAVKNRIFEPFFSTKQDQGTGLGLSVAYGIIAHHRGFIDVTSRPNEGATFTIYLPIGETEHGRLEAKLPFRAAQDDRHDSGAPRHTILFVEDEVRQLELMQRFLERNGYRVLTATNGLEAVEIHLRHKDEISVVVLDFGIPGLTGWEAFQRMKQVNPNLKAILATGYVSPEIATATTRRELSAVIMKPYQINEILDVISSA
jgi:PAS domain S-box-containing protein